MSHSSFRIAIKQLQQWIMAARLRGLRALGFKPFVLIVAENEESPEAQRTIERLRFYAAAGTSQPLLTRVAARASTLDTLLAAAVLLTRSPQQKATRRRLFNNTFDVDSDRNPTDGWEWSRFSQYLTLYKWPKGNAQAGLLLDQTVNRIRARNVRHVYVFGTGPSLARAAERTFADGAVIVCNTIARDAALWHHLRPDFVVAGDAIYHFGHTEHARAFRRDLRLRLAESEGRTLFVYPQLFDAVVRSEMSDLSHLLVPIPIGRHRDITVNLCEHFELPGLGNVLNLLLIPLASTIALDVRLWGFDGRAPNDKLFWSNSSRHSYPELMPALREAHPAFFSHHVPTNNENKYVQDVHGDELDAAMTRAERRGFRFTMLHESWTPTLRKRMHPLVTSSEVERQPSD